MNQSAETERGRETETVPNVAVQFVFYPNKPRLAMASIPKVEQAAAEFFSEDPKCTNIFVIEAPLLPGLDIPHFLDEYRRTGKYFEGYIQHTRTGFQRLRPFRTKRLAKMRDQTEERIASHPYSDNEEEQETLFFASSLLMLDKLAGRRKFQIRIEPLNVRDVAKDVVRTRRALNKLNETWSGTTPDTDAPLQTEQDIEDFIEQLRQQETDYFRTAADVLRPGLTHFHNFLTDLIVWAVNGNQKIRIFVVRPSLWQELDRPNFQGQSLGNQKFAYMEPVVIPDERYRHGLETLTRFIDEPGTETTRQEIIDNGLLTLIQQSLAGMGMESQFEEGTLEFLQNSQPEERERVLFEIWRRTEEGTIDSRVMLVDFFGGKIFGEEYDGRWGNLLRWFAKKQK